jgi:hypothetical protein
VFGLLDILASGFQTGIRVTLSLLLGRRLSRQSREQVYIVELLWLCSTVCC